MQTGDREEFEEQLTKLCAGYNLPVTVHRKEAYFTGLGKMSLAQFARCVDFAVSEEGPEDFPTTRGVWKIHRDLRGRGASAPSKPQRPPEDQRDHLVFYANRMFLRHVVTSGGLGSIGRFVPTHGMADSQASSELTAARRFVRDLVDCWCAYIREGDTDATQAEFIRQFSVGLHRISKVLPATQLEWEARRSDPRTLALFPASMARELEPRYQTQPEQLALTG